VLRGYLGVVGAGLLLQGAISLVLLDAFGVDPMRFHGIVAMDDRHATLHVVWGLFVLGVLARGPGERTLIALGSFFGVFYLALGLLGVFVHDPFGLRLGWGENGFHLIVGPLALLLTLLAAREVQQPALPEAT
jgi:hypothetical protein